MHIERSGQLRIFLECRSASGKSSDWQEKCGRPTRSRSAARTRTDAAHRLTLAICSVASIIASCRAAAPPLEVPFADWDAGAGQGPSCSVTQDGKSGDHVPYFRWSGDHVAVCVEPARDPGSTCMSTERSVCTKACDTSKADGSGDAVSCTGFCRCEPACGETCEVTCCRLAFDLDPPGCSVLRYDCDYRQTFMEASECDANTHLCTCGPGYCGYNVSDDGHMACVDGLGAPCMACPRGSFKTTISLAACEACALGYSTLNAGASRKEHCLPLCPNGTWSDTGFEPCTACPLGTFQPAVGRTSCLECPFGSNTTGLRSTSEEDCCRACGMMIGSLASSLRSPFPMLLGTLSVHLIVLVIL